MTSTPKQLKHLQEWFGSIIAQPIDSENCICPITPSGNSIKEEASHYIVPSKTLQPDQRIEIYNQQYWWRFFKCLQESFPFLLRLFGYESFNRTIVTPYLVKYPPHHWSLNFLGERLPQWVQEEYHAKDKELVLYAALIDQAYNHSFVVENAPLISDNLMDISEKPLTLQPHVHCFSLPYNLFSFRLEFLKHDTEYWQENDFPKLKKEKCHIILYRTKQNLMDFEVINEHEFAMINKFKNGISIDALCSYLEELPKDHPLLLEAENNMHLWFQRWVGLQWLSIK